MPCCWDQPRPHALTCRLPTPPPLLARSFLCRASCRLPVLPLSGPACSCRPALCPQRARAAMPVRAAAAVATRSQVHSIARSTVRAARMLAL